MTRRTVLSLAVTPILVGSDSPPATDSVRGTLSQTEDHRPALKTAEGRTVFLDGDDGTRAVLDDQRLRGLDLEALGHFTAPDAFHVDPIYQRAMFIHKDGKRLFITYWCDVCYIRTYVPGNCRCCQKYTDLDLRENDAQ
ncbi:MAG TPA: hypothetical protein VMJ34_04660 [Bryobacteraceae bacterium]|nr:hypothetical protein [Bryobacteraceae bacterium]